MDRKNPKVRKDLHVYSTMDRKNPKVRKDLNILRAVPVLLIKVLTDLKRFLPLPPELLRCAQTALILFILSILSILLQTTEKNALPSLNRWRVPLPRRNSRKGTLFRSVRTCMSIARRPEKDPKVR